MARFNGILIAVAALLLVACAGGRQEPLPTRAFPEVRFPAMLPQEEAADYALDHFWDAYLDTTGRYLCDSTHIAGVSDRTVATQLATYLSVLENLPSQERNAARISSFFNQVERYQAADTASNVFRWMADAVDYYLFDPNSEIRSEELYLPYVSRLAVSPFAKESMRERYAYATRVCSTHRIGTPASDFRFIDARGREHTLSGERAPLTILLFVNPGCHACEETVDAFGSERMRQMVADGQLKIISVYIDEEVDEWLTKAGGMPAHWINGYDPDGLIRSDQLYFVRAIPSVYLLDAQKNIIMKDAVPGRVAAYIENE